MRFLSLSGMRTRILRALTSYIRNTAPRTERAMRMKIIVDSQFSFWNASPSQRSNSGLLLQSPLSEPKAASPLLTPLPTPVAIRPVRASPPTKNPLSNASKIRSSPDISRAEASRGSGQVPTPTVQKPKPGGVLFPPGPGVVGPKGPGFVNPEAQAMTGWATPLDAQCAC